MAAALATVLLPAPAEKRAKRRYDELIAKGAKVEYNTVLEELIQRDYNDSHREVAPLKPAEDSILVDTSDLSLEESIDKVVSTIKEKIG